MNDLISRKALIAEYDRVHIGKPGGARKLMEDAPAVQQWISVKDRLPDRNDMVIAFYHTMSGTSGEMQIHKAWAMSDTCTHWMPLPQPPKGE